MPSRRQSDADKKVMEQPTAEKVMEEKKFSLDEMQNLKKLDRQIQLRHTN